MKYLSPLSVQAGVKASLREIPKTRDEVIGHEHNLVRDPFTLVLHLTSFRRLLHQI